MQHSKVITKLLLLSSALLFTLSSCQKEKPLQPGELIAKEIQGSWRQLSYLENGQPINPHFLSESMTFFADAENSQEGRYENTILTGAKTTGQYAVSYSGDVIYINNQENAIVIENNALLLKSEKRDRRGRTISTLSTYIKL